MTEQEREVLVRRMLWEFSCERERVGYCNRQAALHAGHVNYNGEDAALAGMRAALNLADEVIRADVLRGMNER